MSAEEVFKANIEHIKEAVYEDFNKELECGFVENGESSNFTVDEIELGDDYFALVNYTGYASWKVTPQTYDNPEEWYGYYKYDITKVVIFHGDKKVYENTYPDITDYWEE